MSITYCDQCEKLIDPDEEVEHFEMHQEEQIKEKLFEEYKSEFQVINGINQHPGALNFEEWLEAGHKFDPQSQSELFKELPEEELIAEICNLVFNDNRAMPAHFTSNGDRTQSFCVDFDDIDADDEYQMASASYYWLSEYLDEDENLSHSEIITLIRCGEDLMISSYIVHKLGRTEVLKGVTDWLIEASINGWPKDMNVDQLFKSKSAQNWFNFCIDYGQKVVAGEYV